MKLDNDLYNLQFVRLRFLGFKNVKKPRFFDAVFQPSCHYVELLMLVADAKYIEYAFVNIN